MVSHPVCDEDLIPIFPDDPPAPDGRLPPGCAVVFRSPCEDWSTPHLRSVIARSRAHLADGAQPEVLVCAIDKARRILESRGLTTETVE